MSMRLKWSGWEIQGSLLLTPRRVRLNPAELRIFTVLLKSRLRQQPGQPQHFIPAQELRAAASMGSVETLRSWVSNLRDAIGRDAIETSRKQGYLLLPASGNRNDQAPIDQIVRNLTNALAEAKRLQKSIKEGLYHEGEVNDRIT